MSSTRRKFFQAISLMIPIFRSIRSASNGRYARPPGTASSFIDATGIATALLGNSIAANMFMLGYAWQKGLVPLDDASLLHAIALNGEAVEMNQAAFLWGRREAADPPAVEAVAAPLRRSTATQRQSRSLDEVDREARLLSCRLSRRSLCQALFDLW